MENFITIKENVQVEIVEKKSKFICNLYKVNSQSDAEELINKTKKKYFDAKHNCVSYRVIENDKIIEKASDDGEPSGTAGGPMLNILQKNNLCNILVIVTRYFGGILLGTGGLVRAYSDCTIKAIEKSEKVEKCFGIEAKVVLEYSDLENFKYYCKNSDINIVNIEYLEKIVCRIELEEIKNPKILEDFNSKKVNIIDFNVLYKKIIDKCILK